MIKKAIEYFEEPIGKSLEEHRKAVELAIEALEKQIIKKPYQSYYNEGDYEWVCSTCESTINEPHRKYCGWCGQKLM